jgi:hypothetical protein
MLVHQSYRNATHSSCQHNGTSILLRLASVAGTGDVQLEINCLCMCCEGDTCACIALHCTVVDTDSYIHVRPAFLHHMLLLLQADAASTEY